MILGIVVAAVILAGLVSIVLVDARSRSPEYSAAQSKPELLPEDRKRIVDLRFQWASTIIGGVGVFGALGASIFAGGAYYAAKGQLDAMLDDKRPWIRVDLIPDRIRWILNGHQGLVDSSIKYTNTGKSPAYNVELHYTALLMPSDRKVFAIQTDSPVSGFLHIAESKQTLACGRNGVAGYTQKAGIVFPDEKEHYSSAQILLVNDNKLVLANGNTIDLPVGVSPKVKDKKDLDGTAARYFRLFIGGCVSYQYGSPLQTHQTAFYYMVKPNFVAEPIARVLPDLVVGRDYAASELLYVHTDVLNTAD